MRIQPSLALERSSHPRRPVWRPSRALDRRAKSAAHYRYRAESRDELALGTPKWVSVRTSVEKTTHGRARQSPTLQSFAFCQTIDGARTDQVEGRGRRNRDRGSSVL